MGKKTNIEWTDHTFNPWRGCTKVSPGCEHCYAETLSKRNPAVLGQWGKGKPRVLASEDMWRQPLKWNKVAGNTRVLAGETFVGWADCTSGIDTPKPTKSVLADGPRGPTSFSPEDGRIIEP